MGEESIPVEILEMINYKNWGKLTRKEKLDLVNCAITDIYMAEDFDPDKRCMRKITQLNSLRKKLIANNWEKPKYDD